MGAGPGVGARDGMIELMDAVEARLKVGVGDK